MTLFDVHREREEVGAFANLARGGCGHEDLGVSDPHDDCAVGELSEFAGAKRNFDVADHGANRGLCHAFLHSVCEGEPLNWQWSAFAVRRRSATVN